MKRTKKVLLALGCIALLLTGCETGEAIETKEEIAKPSTITIYDKGESKELGSDDSKFVEIYDMNKERVKEVNGSLNIAIKEEEFKIFKEEGISVEFKYDKEHILKYTDKDGKEKEVLYTELFFPLSDGELAKNKDDSTTVIAVGKSNKEMLVELEVPNKILELVSESEAE